MLTLLQTLLVFFPSGVLTFKALYVLGHTIRTTFSHMNPPVNASSSLKASLQELQLTEARLVATQERGFSVVVPKFSISLGREFHSPSVIVFCWQMQIILFCLSYPPYWSSSLAVLYVYIFNPLLNILHIHFKYCFKCFDTLMQGCQT